jgi:hypothetical protein
VLFVRYQPDEERWWLPGEDLEPYEHPDQRARAVLAGLEPLEVKSMAMNEVESFRGRRGWHVIFTYRVEADGEPGGEFPAEWFPADEVPKTKHGRWERERVSRVLGVPA